jgi:hypothetical protein
MSNTHIDQIAEIMRRAVEEAEARAYERGRADERAEMLAILQSGAPQSQHRVSAPATQYTLEVPAQHVEYERPASDRKRAPKGLVPKFVQRVLAENPGLTPKGILARASDEYERMIKPASVRGELRQGKDHGRYTTDDGRWYLVSSEAEDRSSTDQTSASDSSQGGSEDAAALDKDVFG